MIEPRNDAAQAPTTGTQATFHNHSTCSHSTTTIGSIAIDRVAPAVAAALTWYGFRWNGKGAAPSYLSFPTADELTLESGDPAAILPNAGNGSPLDIVHAAYLDGAKLDGIAWLAPNAKRPELFRVSEECLLWTRETTASLSEKNRLLDSLGLYGPDERALLIDSGLLPKDAAAPEPTGKDAPTAEVDAPEDSRPAIYIKGGALPEMVDQAELAMLSDTSRPAIYKRDIGLVRTARAASDSVTGHIRRQAGSLRIIPVDSGYLLERFTQAAKWLRYNERSSSWKPGNAPKLAVDTYLSRVGRWNCDTLTGIIESPTLRPDGSILDIPGYDAVTGLIFDPGATRFEPIPDNPTLDDAREAVKVLLGGIKEFPFIANHDSAVVLVAILTALIRKSLKSAPMIGFTAPVMGSGKSLLADCVALIATGRRAPAWTYTGEPEEERKHITSALIAGDPVICIDNITAPMDGDRLCSVLTQETITDRLLGVMRQVTLSTATCWLATGNNLEIRGDLATRTLVCRLDAATENPEERTFQTDLLTWIPDNRSALVRAALTILRAYHVAGRPRQPIKQFGRFETWSDWPRSALVWVGVPDPCKARIHVAAADPARQQLTVLLLAWYAIFKEQRVTTAEVIKAATVTVSGGEVRYSTPGGDDLRQALLTVAGRGEVIDPRAFGQYLRKNQGRMIGQHRLEQVGDRSHALIWRVSQGKPRVTGVTGVTDYE